MIAARHQRFFILTLAFGVFLGSPAEAAKKPPKPEGWRLRLGLGSFYSPQFLGSNDYQLSVVPYIRLAYSDLFFASIQEGIGLNLIRQDGLTIGPLVRYRFSRDEEGGASPFQVVGDDDDDALRGLGDVDGTVEPGIFIAYRAGWFRGRAELRHGVNGHRSLIGRLALGLGGNVGKLIYGRGPPLLATFQLRSTFVDARFNDTYFGVDAGQSLRSGLPVYDPGGGVLSYGFSATVVAPLSDEVSVVMFGGYDLLTGDVADAPLVRQRGSRSQARVGLFIAYEFGAPKRSRRKDPVPPQSRRP